MDLAGYILISTVIFIVALYQVYLFIYLRNSLRKLPYVPVRLIDIQRIIAIADIKNEKNFYELGSGDGRVMIEFAKHGLNCTGFELSRFYVFVTNLKAKIYRLKNCRAKNADMFTADLSDAEIVYCYLTPEFSKMVCEKLFGKLKKGTKVISYCFPIERMTPQEVCDIYGKRKIFLYKI